MWLYNGQGRWKNVSVTTENSMGPRHSKSRLLKEFSLCIYLCKCSPCAFFFFFYFKCQLKSSIERVSDFYLFIYLFIYLCLFRAAGAAFGGSQARGRIRAVAACLHHSNAGSLTHSARPGIEPVSSWILVVFLTC